jgi:hypothetical protein
MNRYALILEEWNRIVTEEIQLNQEYEGKPKGNIYTQRSLDILNKKVKCKNQVSNIGTLGTICKVSGKRSRASLKNPRIMIQERFNLFFVNVSEEEVSFLVKFHVKNLIQYKVEFYQPGKILTTD